MASFRAHRDRMTRTGWYTGEFFGGGVGLAGCTVLSRDPAAGPENRLDIV